MKWRLIGALCAALFSIGASAADAQNNNIRLGQIGISFYAVTGGVIQEVLERLGHTVEVSQGSHSQIFPRLGAGEIDLLVRIGLQIVKKYAAANSGMKPEQIMQASAKQVLELAKYKPK